MRGRTASELLSLSVRMHGIQLGTPVDALLDRDDDRLLGFELRCGDGGRRFLPFAVAQIRADEICISSALMLIDEPDLDDFYLRRARRLSELALADPWVDDDGRVHETLTAA
jgi:hypothetical protein